MDYPRWTGPYFERIRPTFLEAWPKEVARLSVSHVSVPLTWAEVEAIVETPPLWRDRLTNADPPALRTLATKLQPLIDTYTPGAFIRLGSRSPKDTLIFQASGGRIRRAVTAIKLIQSSLRAQSDLRRCRERDYAPYLFVREWLLLHSSQEFQCFLRDRKLVGISQLDCVNYGAIPELKEAAVRLEPAIREFAARFASVSHLPNAVFDVVIPHHPSLGRIEVRLLDINPWGPPTATQLFDWGKPEDFDGSFRYLR